MKRHVMTVLALLAWTWTGAAPAAVAETGDPADVFGRFTAHIGEQIQSDKRTFLDAQLCTEWFYKQRYQKPPRPEVEGVSWPARSTRQRPTFASAECETRYPGGLESARDDFSRRQSTLSISLTFYELALVGDRNDDQRYSAAELQDILESFGLPYDALLAPSAHLSVLNAKFDALRRAGDIEPLIASLGTLFDRGYRFTEQDMAALNRVSG
ncbi:hypothetical protein [Nitrospira sp. Kam-Ns4a]